MKFKFPFKITRRLLATVALILVVVVAAIVAWVTLTTPKSSSPASVVIVQRGDLSASVNATGKIRAKKSVRLSLPFGGTVQSISKFEGDAVNLGDVILTLRADESLRRVKQAELNLQNRQLDLARAKAAPRSEDIEIARASLRKATVAVAAAEAAYTANPTLSNEAVREVTRVDLDVARASFNRLMNGASKEELDELQNVVTVAQMDLDAARTLLTQVKLTAPFTSTVTEINVREGEYTGGGQVATVADLTTLEIAADVDEIDVANVQVGQSVEVRLDAFPGEKFTGKLVRLFPAASTQRGSTTYPAVVEFDPRNIKVRIGMGANLKILTIEKKNVLLVPNRALQNVGVRKAVHVVAPGEPRDVLVETGATDGNQTEIISGLNEGDHVRMP